MKGLICVGQNTLEVEKFSIESSLAFSKHATKAFFHVCTDGNSLDWMFKDYPDFVAGMNRTGICRLISGARTIYFILMDNHVHFLLYGSMPACKEFIITFKKLLSKHICSKYGLKGYLQNVPTEIIRINSPAHLVETIAYFDRNPTAAGWKFMPYDYPWGLGRFMFRRPCGTAADNMSGLRRLDSFSRKTQHLMFGTHLLLPQDWIVDQYGMIDPRCYVDMEFIESLFKSPGKYTYYLSKKLEGEIEKDFNTSVRTFIQDKELRMIVEKIAGELYGTRDIRILDINSRITLARKLRYEYASPPKQISRMLHLNVELLKGFI